MAGPAEAHGPTYISSRSADVILSDIRPVKLNVEALRSINVFLDELLYSVLNAAHSLTTHQLRSGLLKVLPTTLGKEALLEAEMELRAYQERTAASGGSLATEEQRKEFHLQWCFELLRLKCQAYSTLNDSDEDAQAETRLTERMNQAASGVSPPKATLVAPAALYLTAILESVCEHVLSNVGRVATRDSSRTTATVQDLFVALCEDDSIYGLFKDMKVYEKIEDLSKIPKPRRSKSFSRPNGTTSVARTSSPRRADSHPPSALTQTSSLPPRSRLSSESLGSMTTTVLAHSNGPTSRSSFDKARAMKMFSNNRSSADQAANGSLSESQRSHKKSDSVLSDSMKQIAAAYNTGDYSPTDDKEFDDMMRSGGTMKVSLTPDRLKSMEVYNKEKGQRGVQKIVQKSDSRGSLKSNNIMPPTPDFPRQLSGSTVDEGSLGNKKPANRTRQTSLSNSTPPVTAAATRLRTISASIRPGEKFSHTARKLSKTSALPSSPPSTYQSRERNMPVQQPNATDSLARTRNIATNRGSLDLDDMMGTSEDDEILDEVIPKTPVSRPTQYPVSAGARDLINFLAEGPPEKPEEPVGASRTSNSQDTPKKGRLQRMISKLTLKDVEQKHSRSTGSSSADSYPKSSRRTPSTTGSSVTQSPMASPLYNKPVPPRPPPMPISPQSTPSHSSTSLAEPSPPSPRALRTSNMRKSVPSSWDPGSVTPESPRTPIPVAKGGQDMSPARVTPPSPKPPSVNGQAKSSQAKEEEKPRSNITRVSKQSPTAINGSGTKVLLSPPERRSSKRSSDTARKSPDSDQSTAVAAFTSHAQEMRRLLAQASNVDECRLIVDMFVAKSGLQLEPVDHPNPSPPSNVSQSSLPQVDANLEHSLVELFLGGAGEESEGDGDEHPLSPTDSAPSKVALPMSPPDTPDAIHGNGSRTAELVVTQTATPTMVAAT